MTRNMDICINVGGPCISPANHLFCVHNHENENASGPNRDPVPAPGRSLDVAGGNVHARNVHEDEVDSSKSSRCVDDTAQGTRDDFDQSRHVDRHPCETEVVGMASGCHHACGVEAVPDEGDVVGMVTDCHLAHGGVANRGDGDEAALTCDDENGGHEKHVTNPHRCQNLTT